MTLTEILVVKLGARLGKILLKSYLRDPAEAIQLGERARTLSKGADPSVLDAVAAAYAEAGRFEDAIGAVERGIAMLRASARSRESSPLEGRLWMYRHRMPYRQQPG